MVFLTQFDVAKANTETDKDIEIIFLVKSVGPRTKFKTTLRDNNQFDGFIYFRL